MTLACAGREAPAPPAPVPPADPVALRERGLLLLLDDRRIYDSFTIDTVLEQQPALRDRLALTLGRVGDPRGRAILHLLLVDPQPRARRAAAFALGQLGDPASVDLLLRAVGDEDAETGALAVASLAALEVDPATVVEASRGLPPESAWRRLLPYLSRFPADRVFDVARQALELADPELRAMALYALAREGAAAAAPLLRPALQDPDPWVRAWAARGLGRIGDRSDLERLRPLLRDPEPGPIIQALQAARGLIERGAAAAPEDWRQPLRALLDDPRPGVALTALECASAWLLDAELGEALWLRVEQGGPRARETALLALARGGDARAADFVRGLVDAPPSLRLTAARAAAALGDEQLLGSLLLDSSARVRAAALTGLLAGPEPSAGERARQALADPDPVVRAIALEWLVEHPVAPVAELSLALVAGSEREVIELRVGGIRALVARALEVALERGLAVRNLESLVRVGDYPARREAAAGLERLGRPRPALGPADTGRTAGTYTDMVRRTAEPRDVELVTRHGAVRLRLDCPNAPIACLNFLQLANQGFYDGLRFHRVVPDFVVQAGDPRGDGWGGPGYTLRDELRPRRFERGVLGMASSGPDTAGSQFFITLSRQPHLDGRYTAFGEVVAGDHLLDRIVQGDRIERAREAP